MVPSQLMSLFHQAIYPKHIAAAIQNNEDLENLYHQGRASTVESTYRNKQHKKDESLSVEDDLIIHIAFVRLSIQLIAVILPFVGFVSIWGAEYWLFRIQCYVALTIITSILVAHRLNLASPHFLGTLQTVHIIIHNIVAQATTGGLSSPLIVPPIHTYQFMLMFGGERAARIGARFYVATLSIIAVLDRQNMLPEPVVATDGISSAVLAVMCISATLLHFIEDSVWYQTVWLHNMARLQRKATDAEHASFYKSNFLAVMSHELRTPLHHVMVLVELLEQEMNSATSTVGSIALHILAQSFKFERPHRHISLLWPIDVNAMHMTIDWRELRPSIYFPLKCKEKVQSGASAMQQKCGYLMGTLRSSAQILLDVIEDVLDLSKIESGKHTVDLQPDDVTRVVARIVDAFAPSAQAKGLDLIFSSDVRGPETFLLDRICIQKIVMNILGNAIKFTAKGSITVALHVDSQGLRILFTDTGVGIDKEEMRRLFRPFVQADACRSTRRFGGSGLGLVIAKSMAQLMGGDITVKSVKGSGSTFTFSMPVTRAPEGSVPNRSQEGGEDLERIQREVSARGDAANEASGVYSSERLGSSSGESDNDSNMDSPPLSPPSSLEAIAAEVDAAGLRQRRNVSSVPSENIGAGPSRKASLSGIRALVVDDNELNCKLMARLLASLGAQVDCKLNGETAIEALSDQKYPYDVMLLDICMPGMDGFEVAKLIRSDEVGKGKKRLPIIAVTATTLKDDKERSLAVGMDCFLSKPVRKFSLEQMVLEVLAQR